MTCSIFTTRTRNVGTTKWDHIRDRARDELDIVGVNDDEVLAGIRCNT